jgi:hypothetical protein
MREKTVEKLDGKSMDIVAENIEKLKDNMDNASEFMLDRATEDALESYVVGVRKDEICPVEWEESLELALSYYSIERWEV